MSQPLRQPQISELIRGLSGARARELDPALHKLLEPSASDEEASMHILCDNEDGLFTCVPSNGIEEIATIAEAIGRALVEHRPGKLSRS